ncbi:pilin [Streptomyces sp. NPDC046909]|uniref:pilin n=1 Tax=Streptomyces sp. NPDC046909 TaxID=3155617 RepID=UPI0033CF81DF
MRRISAMVAMKRRSNITEPPTPRLKRSARNRAGRAFRWTVLGLIATATALLCTSTAHAAGAEQVLALAKSVDEVLDNIRNWIMGILAGLATVFLSIGGVRYVMAGGDPGEVEKAKTAFKSAGYGYGLAALAPLVVEILKGIVGA